MAEDHIERVPVRQPGSHAGLHIWHGAVHQGVVGDEPTLVADGVVQVVERVLVEVHVGE